MKKNITSILIIILIIFQAMSLARIGELQNDLRNMHNQLTNIEYNQSRELSNIYANIDAQLKRQSSIIESFDYSLGKIDSDTLKVPITFKITPKETKSDTQATLYVAEERVVMSKNGTTYTATVGVDIFKPIEAKVVLADSGIEKTEKLDILEDLRGNLLPLVHARFERKGGGTIYSISANQASGEYHATGLIIFEAKPVLNNRIEKARLVIDVDGKEVIEEPINTGGIGSEIDKKLSLSAGDTLTMAVIATDSLGLNYHTIIDKLTLDEKATPVRGEEWHWLGEVTITDKEGKVLYSSFEEKLN